MNGGWNIFELFIIVSFFHALYCHSDIQSKMEPLTSDKCKYWPETRGLSLEEISVLFDGEIHSQVTDVKHIIEGVPSKLDTEKVQSAVKAELSNKSELVTQ